ncbi:MAG: GTPase ObgE [bacterium]|jgi:GTP-binding protein|nr:GTPase ObgE [bacterium]
MPQFEGSFIDRVRLRLKAGDGGDGVVSFRHEKYVPFGGPDGGDGGNGGSILLQVNPGLNTLEKLHSQPFYRAPNGERGGKNKCSGACGLDLVLEVPPGTVVKNLDTGDIILDMETTDGRAVVAQGGRGGKGNIHFTSSTNQTPHKATPGTEGEEFEALFELKTVAHVGLVGLPNAGKSTFISSITGAKPRIASYPFTTLQPILGAIGLYDGSTIVIADIPGIIEGAHEGIGLGLDFLRHIERTKMIIYVIELSPHDHTIPAQTLNALRHEIRQYDPSILERPYLIALNKVDLLEDQEELELILHTFRDAHPDIPADHLFVISAEEKKNTESLRKKIIAMYMENLTEPPMAPEEPFDPFNE